MAFAKDGGSLEPLEVMTRRGEPRSQVWEHTCLR
jgi:hypothetical protein